MRLRLRVVVPLLLALVAAGAPLSAAEAATNPTTGFRWIGVPAADGVRLAANVVEPTTPGRHPAIVFISSWGLNDAEYLVQADHLARAGYTVLSYTTRGFWGSGGQIDTGGPKDVSDVSAVLDWLTAHTTADPDRIGVSGVSYGSGIALIAAGFDPRIKAVAAMSCWVDLVDALYAGQTRHVQAVLLLQAVATLTGRPGPELNQALADYFANRNVEATEAWARKRSALTYLSEINAHHPAVLIANAYGDSVFGPNPLIDFFAGLTGPKRLELAPGDHAVVEATGLLGLDNHVWTSVRRWFDHYLSNVDNGIAGEPAVVLRTLGGQTAEGYADWAHVSTGTARYALGPVPWTGTGVLGDEPDRDWSQRIWTGLDTTADAGVALLSNGLAGLSGIPPINWLPTVSRINGAVWDTGALAGGAHIRGIARLRLSLRSAPPTGTLVGYLYDADALGIGRLITAAPVTWTAPTTSVTTAFPVASYDVPVGHHLVLVLDTRDPLYLDANGTIAPITVAGASTLDVPTR